MDAAGGRCLRLDPKTHLPTGWRGRRCDRAAGDAGDDRRSGGSECRQLRYPYTGADPGRLPGVHLYSIERPVMPDLGGRGITFPDDISVVESARAQLHDFVGAATRGQLAGRRESLERLSAQSHLRDGFRAGCRRREGCLMRPVRRLAFNLLAMAAANNPSSVRAADWNTAFLGTLLIPRHG